MQPRAIVELLFGLRVLVSRRAYLTAGITLMALKYGVDVAIVYTQTGHIWTPWEYLSPVFTFRQGQFSFEPESHATIWMAVWTLPFLWIGASMSVRRAIHAGLSPIVGLLFFVPFVNWISIGMLSILPARLPEQTMPSARAEDDESFALAAFKGVSVGVGLAVGSTAVSTLILGSYGSALFLGTPFIIGFFAAWFLNQRRDRGVGPSLGVTTLAMALAGAALMLFALEGLFCLLMAFPIALAIGFAGAMVGRGVARAGHTSGWKASTMIVMIPFLLGAEQLYPEPPVREVMTWVEIDAPPSVVWPHVIGFAELPDDDLPWYFAMGIAYPQRAVIDGRGVGAVRYCEFSTGPFVEPITVWDEPHRLAFDVVDQPPSMHEWSPWERVHAPHVDGYIVSHRGEFRLTELPGGRTRLEGSTWYHLDMAPQSYWTLYSDWLLHSIHRRVLHHVRDLSESDVRSAHLLPAPTHL